MKKPEKWQLVLLALYAEAIHCGSFAEVTSRTMGMEPGEFGWTLYNLQMRGLIAGCTFQPPHPDTPGNVMGLIRDSLMLTPEGFRLAERLLGAGKTEDQALHGIWCVLRDAGCGVMANIVHGWLC